jgi:hypothetical protein
MSWILVVSQDESFVGQAVAGLRDRTSVVGATGEGGARSLLTSLPVATIVIDARDPMGRSLISSLRRVPGSRVPRIIAVGAQDSFGTEQIVPDLGRAIQTALAVA